MTVTAGVFLADARTAVGDGRSAFSASGAPGANARVARIRDDAKIASRHGIPWRMTAVAMVDIETLKTTPGQSSTWKPFSMPMTSGENSFQ